ncbi:MAG: hypothetical protein WD824_18020 [Cyclobacteriaceae bacterium]
MNNTSKTTGTSSQFQRGILSFLLMPIIALTFSGCVDDFESTINFRNVDLTEKFIWPGLSVVKSRMWIAIDSASQKNDSTLRLFVRLGYDSVVIRSAYGVSYAKIGDTLALTKIFSAKADTLDFRKLPNMNYLYDLDLDLLGLESKVNYTICPFMDYIVKGDTVRLSGSNFADSCFSFKTK